MTNGVEFLDIDDLIALARRWFGASVPIRDVGLLGSAVARPQTTAFGEDAYPDIWSKAAALLRSIVKNHPLVDGNKRLGWLATAVFLELNHASVSAAKKCRCLRPGHRSSQWRHDHRRDRSSPLPTAPRGLSTGSGWPTF